MTLRKLSGFIRPAIPAVILFPITLAPFVLLRSLAARYEGVYYAFGCNAPAIEPTVDWGPWQAGRPTDGSAEVAGVEDAARYRVGTHSSWNFDCQITEVEEAGTGRGRFSIGRHVDVHVLRIARTSSPAAIGITGFVCGAWMLGRAAWSRFAPRPQVGFEVHPLPTGSTPSIHPDHAATTPVGGGGADHDRSE
jgi:hypothetical protein